MLGPGTVILGATLALPAGVTLAGAGPHLTTLRAAGLAAGVLPGAGAQLQQLTVAAAQVGVRVEATGVSLRNVILRDNSEAGLDVVAGGSAAVISATVVRNGIGVRTAGATQVRNALVTANGQGLAAAGGGTVASRYNDVYGNPAGDYQGVTADANDLAQAVSFLGPAPEELRLHPAQPSTDRGDPGDDFSNEPAPNGARINIGAFGNTPFAELSAAGLPAPDAGADGAAGESPASKGCGCALGGAGDDAGHSAAFMLALVVGLRLTRRRSRPSQ
jgi:MYXO-CTERM domain-containing protein